MRSSREENVQEHSLQVAMFAHCLALIENKRYGGALDPLHVIAIAVYHETGEVITGDLVTPIKYYNPQITQAYKEVEKVAEETMIAMLPEEFQADYRELIQPNNEYEAKIVKAADTLAAYAKCIEELKTGNIEFVELSADDPGAVGGHREEPIAHIHALTAAVIGPKIGNFLF
jgi:5'-deoxynucleotidase